MTGPSRFIFSSEDGSIAGWSPAADLNNAIVTYSDGAGGAVYRSLAIAASGNANFLYATDFRNRKVDVFDGSFRKVRLAGDFSDTQLPADYAPYGIQAIGSRIVVTYARQDASRRNAVHGDATGAVNVFNADGTLAQRLLPPGAPLNAPWGVALAPADFGGASGRLLIANEGDGTIGAFDLATGLSKGVLAQRDGTVLRVDGLRGIAFGNGLNQQPLNTLFYIAGRRTRAPTAPTAGWTCRTDLGETAGRDAGLQPNSASCSRRYFSLADQLADLRGQRGEFLDVARPSTARFRRKPRRPAPEVSSVATR